MPEPDRMHDEEWPFPEPPTSAAIIPLEVFQKKIPLLRVEHREEGEWHFRNEAEQPGAERHTLPLGDVVAVFPELRAVADIPVGWIATRSGLEQDWSRTPKAFG